MSTTPAEVVKPRDCKFCAKPYVKPCDGEDPKCTNRQFTELQARQSDEKKA